MEGSEKRPHVAMEKDRLPLLFDGRVVCGRCVTDCETCQAERRGMTQWEHGIHHMLPCIAHGQIQAITVWQPWASCLADGTKRYETRSWTTSYRGLLAIHAGTTKKGFGIAGWGVSDDFPLGAIVAIGTLGNVSPTHMLRQQISEEERSLGDWGADRFAWRLDDVRQLSIPIPAEGKQGLWELDQPDRDALEFQLRNAAK